MAKARPSAFRTFHRLVEEWLTQGLSGAAFTVEPVPVDDLYQGERFSRQVGDFQQTVVVRVVPGSTRHELVCEVRGEVAHLPTEDRVARLWSLLDPRPGWAGRRGARLLRVREWNLGLGAAAARAHRITNEVALESEIGQAMWSDCEQVLAAMDLLVTDPAYPAGVIVEPSRLGGTPSRRGGRPFGQPEQPVQRLSLSLWTAPIERVQTVDGRFADRGLAFAYCHNAERAYQALGKQATEVPLGEVLSGHPSHDRVGTNVHWRHPDDVAVPVWHLGGAGWWSPPLEWLTPPSLLDRIEEGTMTSGITGYDVFADDTARHAVAKGELETLCGLPVGLLVKKKALFALGHTDSCPTCREAAQTP